MKKIGFDIHGVIDSNPCYFADLIKKYRDEGFEIHIITGSPLADMEDKLYGWGIVYDQYFGIADWCLANSKTAYIDNGEVYDTDDVWNTAKSMYCVREGIDVHVDDSDIYQQTFKNISTRYHLYDETNRMEMRQIIASINDCEHYPCTKGCPQYILYREKARKAIISSRLVKAIPNDVVLMKDNGSVAHKPVTVDDLIEELVDEIFLELG